MSQAAQVPGAPVVLDAPNSSASSDTDETKQAFAADEKLAGGSTIYDVSAHEPLAPRIEEAGSTGHGLLVIFGIKKREHVLDADAIATQESVFDGPLASHYVPPQNWENFAHFKPSLRWTFREEAQASRKIDTRIFLWMMFMFLSLNICRYNITNATADNLLKDLKITQADYNFGNTLFRVGFLAAELPSQIIGKKLGIDRWLPVQMIVFALLTFGQFWMNGRASFLAFRFLIAFFQGGFIPDTILYLSYFYTKQQLPLRLAVFWCMNSFSNVLNGFLAVGLLEMRGVLGYAGWRWMFLIEGLLVALVGVAAFFMMSPSPSETKTKWRPNGWFNDRDVDIIVNRVIRDDPTKSSMHNREGLSPKLLWKAFCDFDLWPLYFVGLTFGLPGYPLSNYFQISMRRLGFSTLMANLLSIPHTFITIINLILVTFASEAYNNRWLISSIENLWFLPFFIALRAVSNDITPWSYFVIATLVLGYPYVHAIQVSWTSRNAGSVRTRTVSAALYNMFVQASGAIGANLYQANDAPHYPKANTAIIAIILFNLIIVYPATAIYYKRRNASKAKRWDAMSVDEQSHYLATTTDEGAKRLDFRFVY